MHITVKTIEAQNGFYPTPPELAEKLLEGLKWGYEGIKTVLEPSAGTGNLIKAVIAAAEWASNGAEFEVDMIELDPALRGILADTFSEKAKDAAYEKNEELRQTYYTALRNQEPHNELERKWLDAKKEYDCLKFTSPRIVHDNFLTYDSRKPYDLIVMNPPFEDGDLHLMKAIALQERYGGQIRCILNANTILKPCTNRRKALVQKLRELNAEICMEQGAFKDAERQTDVDVAIIRIDIPVPVHTSDIYEKLKKAQEENTSAASGPTELVENDFIRQIIAQYNLEVDTGCELIRQYNAAVPYILDSFGEDSSPVIRLAISDSHADKPDINKFLKAVRMKYWRKLFQDPRITGQLTSNLSHELHAMVREMQYYDFSEYNILCLICEINCKMERAVQEAILELFDTLSTKHSWYPECQKNIHYYNGWASNKAHKVNKKVVIPAHGVFDCYGKENAFNTYNAFSFLSDIEKCLNYLDGNRSVPVSIDRQLRLANSAGKTRNIQLKFFDVSFFKKGTCHITFTNMELLDCLNIYASRKKAWLPPYYGRKRYADMDTEEQSVIDSFHGDGTPGSGASGYAEVLAKPDYYLADPTGTKRVMIEGI